MTTPTYPRWRDLDENLKAGGINIGWTGNDDRSWHIGGFMGGAEGALITGPISGMVHVPFKGIWHEPAYGPPRFERTVDERREISTRITLFSDHEFGWFDTETKWWNGMDGKTPGWWDIFTRRHGQLWIPLQLLEAVQTDLDDDPTTNGNQQEWDILLAADGDPRWRTHDLRPPEWVNDMSKTTTVVAGPGILAPTVITVGVGKLRVANRGTEPAWPVFTVTAPGRVWISNGSTTDMVQVPRLFPGEHVTIDTNPEHRIAISDIDPADDWMKQIIRNSELLSWLFGEYGDSGETILERFRGQGFSNPIEPGTVATLTVFHSQPNARVSVRLPQRFERPFS